MRGMMRLAIMGVPGAQEGGGDTTPWYLAPDVDPSACVAAYQPIGAASLASSYVNIANPGTHDLTIGLQPGWATETGWQFNSTYLVSDIVPSAGWSAIVRYSNLASTNDRLLFGRWNSTNTKFGIAPNRTSNTLVEYYNGGAASVGPAASRDGGVLAIAGQNGYRDGVDEVDIPVWDGTDSNSLLIGGHMNNGVPVAGLAVYIQAIAFYNEELTPTQVATISARMAALPL